ncbi:MAG: FxsA family protein [Gammaproteobacteria bacterium]
MNPFSLLFLAFLLIPLIEIYFLIHIGGVIGSLPTVFLVVFTAVLGVLLLRYQGWVTLNNFRQSVSRGAMPAMEIMEGALLLVAGALLLTPGFFTDAIGFALLTPPLRRYFIRHFLSAKIHPAGSSTRRSTENRSADPKIIEGEYHREDD